MGSGKKVATGVIWTTLVNVVNGIYGFISVPILISYFGKGDYGLIGLAMSVNIYLRLMDMGLTSTSIRFFSNWIASGDKERVNRLFGTNLTFYGIVGFINAFVLVILSFFVEDIFNLEAHQEPILRNLFYILAISAFVSWFTACFDQLVRANEYVGWAQRLTLLPKLLQILVLVSTVVCGLNLSLYYALTAFSMFVTIPFLMCKIRELCPYISFTPSFDKAIFREILPYSLNIFSFSIFQFSFYNLRPVLLGVQGTMESVGDYRILNGITMLVTMFGGAFIGALLPATSKAMAQGNQGAYYRVAYDGTKYISIVCCFCCFGMMSVSNEIISLYVGDDYLYLVPWLNLWLLSTLATHNQAISSLILSGTDIRAITYNTAFSSIVGLIIAWLLIPSYQIGGVVVAFLVYVLCQLIFYYLYYWPKKMKIDSKKVFVRSFAPFVLLGTTLSVILMNVLIDSFSPFMLLLLKGIIFLFSFLIITWLMLNDKDRLFVKKIIYVKR